MTPPFVKLGDVVDILSGFAFKSEFFNDSDGLPVVRIRDVVRGYTDTYYTGPYTEQFVVRDGDILIGMDGNFNAAKWRGGRALLNQRVCKVTARASLLDETYLFHYLPIALRRIEDATPFVTVKHLSASDLREERIPLPPLAEQRRIAAILDKADALRTKRREALDQLDSVADSIFLDMFGDPVTNPKGWATAAFESLCSRVTVGIVVQPASYYRESGVPALRSLNIKPNKIVLNDLVYFSEQDNNTRLKKTKLKAGDLVVVRSGQPGTAAVVPRELDGINAIDILIASPKATEANSAYLCSFFNSTAGRALILSAQRGQIQKHLNVGSLNSAEIITPPLNLQELFAERLAAVRALAFKQAKGLEQMNSLFASLQLRAFRGAL